MESRRLKDALVTAMLPHAAFDGWTGATLTAAAAELDLDPILLGNLFPGGAADAVCHLVDHANRLMAEDLAALGLDGRGVGEKVFLAVKCRLQRWDDHREAIRRAASLLALPPNLALAAKLTWGTSDSIWTAIGDTSHDFSWYTKRATLAAVYSATLLYWLDDTSEGSEETWAFLRRRLADIRSLPQLRQKLEGMTSGRKAALGGLAQRFRSPTMR
ncbi:MAG: COQ9 family protein, partial [Magnetospirillum sp.]|nr:COQ9 family protein [Magnetospirillum sp.]